MRKFWAIGAGGCLWTAALIFVLLATPIIVEGRQTGNAIAAIEEGRHRVGSGSKLGGSAESSEKWGYVEVRPKAHMFWWLYKSPSRVAANSSKPWPIILWLQGGPGASGVGIGNFIEVGPLDWNLKPRNSTWLQVADLLFVDNPVGTGFSYVEDKKLIVKTDEEAATDLTTLLIKLFNGDTSLQKSPLYIVAESYGGKYAVTLGLSAFKAIECGALKLKLGGVVLGDSWISPQDFVSSWGLLLKDVSRLDDNGLHSANSMGEEIKQQISKGDYTNATSTWSKLEGDIAFRSNNVDFYNFLIDTDMDPVATTATTASMSLVVQSQSLVMHKYSRYLTSLRQLPGGGDNGVDMGSLMEGPIRKKLGIIPEKVTWGAQQDLVFSGLVEDFMKPRINEVDELLSKGVHVTVYNGQLDLICSTKGAESWVSKLKWEGLKTFLGTDRTALSCKDVQGTKGFTKSYKNLHFYWILMAGHFVPVDEPCLALSMISNITQSPAAK